MTALDYLERWESAFGFVMYLLCVYLGAATIKAFAP